MDVIDLDENQRELERRVSEELSIDNAFEFLKKQVKIGQRLSGTPEAFKTVNLIKETLKGYGMESELLNFKGHISIPVETRFRVTSPKAEEIEASAFSWSPSTPPEGIEGELVYVGYGKAEDYQGKEVKGKIVYASLGGGISRARKTEICMGMQPKALVTFNNLPDGPIQNGTCKSVMGNPTPELLGSPYVPDKPVITVDHRNGLRLVEMCKQGPVKVWLKAKLNQGWKDVYELVTNIKGSVEPDRFVMIAAHYDAWGPQGVVCNAVGVAALLELARVFHKFRDQLRRTIRIVFWGAHELGMGAGGAWYIDNHWDDIQDNLVLYSFFDSVGIKDPNVLISNQTPELLPFYKGLLDEVGLPSYIERVEYGVPRGGADIGTYTLYPCVTVLRVLAARDYGPFVERSDFVHTARDTLELAAPAMFEPAFRVLPPAYLRFCNLPVLPLDFSVSGDQILNDLKTFRETGKSLIELRLPLHYAEKFKVEYDRFCDVKKKALEAYGKARTKEEKERFNQIFNVINRPLIRLSRILNRIILSGFLKWDHYSAGLYVNDFDEGIIRLKAIPILEPIKKLVELGPGSDEFGALLTKLVRDRNKISDTLKSSIEILQVATTEAERLLSK